MAWGSCFNRLEINTKDLDKVWNKDRDEVDFSILIPIPNEEDTYKLGKSTPMKYDYWESGSNAFNSKIESQDEDKTVITFDSYWGIENRSLNPEFVYLIKYHWECPKWIDALRRNDIEFSIYCEQENEKKFLKAYVDGHWCQTDICNDFTKEELDGYTIENLKKGIKDEFESGYKYNILLKESWAKAVVLHAVEIKEEPEMDTIQYQGKTGKVVKKEKD